MDKNKLGIIGVVVAVAISGVAMYSASQTVKNTDVAEYVNEQVQREVERVGGQRGGLQEFTDGARLGDENMLLFNRQMQPGDNIVLYTNNSGRNEFISNISVFEDIVSAATPTSARILVVGTTTLTSIPHPFVFGTSTVSGDTRVGVLGHIARATSTSDSLVATPLAKFGVGKGTSTASSDFELLLPSGQSLYLLLTARHGCVSAVGVGNCDNGTTTARNTDPILRATIRRN